ncbi:uncharacterized protein cubi_00208 [Cryptosporidium ubiquitum]|uniref:PI31 proteasome regulator N-terminal domain-containing protein n=1 Tax=Cryptosporidium ubiquitum TaxID=857276 RepID=A0A1J4MKU5_9CRYT|nr:uncharacterized protein cubi_00208 [Cryptosporidium ubiquitum]OII74655.1 hypothetical protein cubi_00208 [Cryptosporidium ubiquitum]
MDRSFWIPILIKHLNPETLQEKVIIITHSLLLDLGFIPVRSINNKDNEVEDASNQTNISQRFEIPISSRDKGILIELLPSNWKSNNGEYRLFYINKTHQKQICELVPELTVEFISSKVSVLSLIRSSLFEETLKLEFPFQTLGHSSSDSLIFELSGSIKDRIDRFFNSNKIYIFNNNSEIDTRERHRISNLRYEPLVETNTKITQKYIGNNFPKSLDPLIDEKGVKGNLVGPESIIFKNQPKSFGIPKNIPTSSIPGGNTIPDNDMFFPPGNNNSNYMFNFSD